MLQKQNNFHHHQSFHHLFSQYCKFKTHNVSTLLVSFCRNFRNSSDCHPLFLLTASSPTVTLPHQSPMTDWHTDKQQHTYSIWELLRAPSSISAAKNTVAISVTADTWKAFSTLNPPPHTQNSHLENVLPRLSLSPSINLSLIQYTTCPPFSPQI